MSSLLINDCHWFIPPYASRFPRRQNPWPIPQGANAPTPVYPYIFTEELPATLDITDSFTFDSVASLPRIPVVVDDVRQSSDTLLGEVFISQNEQGDDIAFMLTAIAMKGGNKEREKVFYVKFADDGEESLAFSEEDFFSLFKSASRVITD